MNIAQMMISAAKTQIFGAPPESFGNLSQKQLESLYNLSKAHDMAHIVATELDSQGLLDNSEICNKFRHQQFVAFMRYERINYELEETVRIFEAKKIEYIPLKGAVMRKFYEEPWMRTSSDIDILVKKEQLDSAAQFLTEELGYENHGINVHDLHMYAPSGVHLELHFDTVEDYRAVNANAILQRIWDNSTLRENKSFCYDINDDMFYFYHIAHMAKHFEESGCGVRFFIDLWLLRHKMQYDNEKREKLLREGGLLKFAQAAEQLSDVWFSGAEYNDVAFRMESYIIAGGIYGSRENRMATVQIKKGGKIGYALSRIFLPYKSLVQYFPSLEKRKILLPFYHVLRWGKIIFGGGVHRSIDELKTSSRVAYTRTDNIQIMLKELGL